MVKDPRQRSSKHRKQLVQRTCLACSRNKNKTKQNYCDEANSSKGKHERKEECGGTRQRIGITVAGGLVECQDFIQIESN